MSEPNPLAFSTVACPDWEVERVIAAAGEYGYRGVELRTFGAGSTRLASDPALSDPEKTRKHFEDSGIDITCLATSLALHYRDEFERVQAMRAGRYFIDLAADIGCPRVRMFGYQVYPGEFVTSAYRRIAERYVTLAEYAEEKDIEILIENAGTFTGARELWKLTNHIDHPLVGVCWNVANAAGIGERPAVSANVLHSRIRYAKVKDTEVGEGSGFVPLGEGSVEVERFVEIMRGIGYHGYFCFEWDKAWLPGLADPEASLPKAVETLNEWMRIKVDKKGKPLSKREAPVLEVKAD